MKAVQNILHWVGKPFRRYALLGGSSLFLTLFFTWLLTEVMGLFYLLSYILVLAAVVSINFVAATAYVFRTRGNHGRRLFYYLVSFLVLYFADVFLVRFLTDSTGLFYLLSVIFSRVFFFLLKYVYYERILFNSNSFLYTKK